MKSEKGITLTSLVIYIAIFTIILGIMSTIATNFQKNIIGVREPQKYITEFNKFCMFFVRDVKNNAKATVETTQITFEDGTIYIFKENAIYRNGQIITEHVINCNFSKSTYNLEKVKKELIDVNMILGTEKEQITRQVEFVLKYW